MKGARGNKMLIIHFEVHDPAIKKKIIYTFPVP
jgi:hypothetical protein